VTVALVLLFALVAFLAGYGVRAIATDVNAALRHRQRGIWPPPERCSDYEE
jgi:hypothetical protein